MFCDTMVRTYTNRWAWKRYIGPDPYIAEPRDLKARSESYKILQQMLKAPHIVKDGVDQSFKDILPTINEQWGTHVTDLYASLNRYKTPHGGQDMRPLWYEQVRRYICGYRQLIDLIEDGYNAFWAAHEDGVLIFEGNRYVSHFLSFSLLPFDLLYLCRANTRLFHTEYGLPGR